MSRPRLTEPQSANGAARFFVQFLAGPLGVASRAGPMREARGGIPRAQPGEQCKDAGGEKDGLLHSLRMLMRVDETYHSGDPAPAPMNPAEPASALGPLFEPVIFPPGLGVGRIGIIGRPRDGRRRKQVRNAPAQIARRRSQLAAKLSTWLAMRHVGSIAEPGPLSRGYFLPRSCASHCKVGELQRAGKHLGTSPARPPTAPATSANEYYVVGGAVNGPRRAAARAPGVALCGKSRR